MPAYFDIEITCKRSELSLERLQHFYQAIQMAGFPYLSGAYEAQGKTMEDIAKWNYELLKDNFKASYEQNVEIDYAQNYFESKNYHEVRGFWLNQSPTKEDATFFILIPEDDLILQNKKGEYAYDTDKIQGLEKFAVALWNKCAEITMIQTGLELSDAAPALLQIAQGKKPLMNPFVVLNEETFLQYQAKAGALLDNNSLRKISCERDGILVDDKAYNEYRV